MSDIALRLSRKRQQYEPRQVIRLVVGQLTLSSASIVGDKNEYHLYHMFHVTS